MLFTRALWGGGALSPRREHSAARTASARSPPATHATMMIVVVSKPLDGGLRGGDGANGGRDGEGGDEGRSPDESGGEGGGGDGKASGEMNRPLKSETLMVATVIVVYAIVVVLNSNWMRSPGWSKFVLTSSSRKRVTKTLVPKKLPFPYSTTSRVTSPSRVSLTS